MRVPRIAELRELAGSPATSVADAVRQLTGIEWGWLMEGVIEALDWMESIGVTDADLPESIPDEVLMECADMAGDELLSECLVRCFPAVAAKILAEMLGREFG